MKFEKISMLISIVLISLIALGAVSAADDVAADDAVAPATVDEVQTIDNTITNDDISYESTDIIVNDTGDSADSKAKTTSLSANAVNEGETLSFTQLAADVSSSPSMLSGAYYKYDPSTDTAFENGITLTNGLTIIGGGATIDGDNQARIFNIPEGVSVTIMGVTLINGAADEGAAIYNSGKLTLMNAKVNDNTAVKSGGGIYNNGGEVLVTSSEFDGNDLTDRTVNGYGGAAIYSNGGSVTITDTNVTNNLKNIVHRGGTGTYTGDLSSAAVTSNNADLTVTNSRFIANSGSYGGAIYSGESTSANLLVSGSTFEDNFAFNGGAIDIVGTSYTISDSTFKNNNVKGTGSTNSNYASGGAICVQDANNPGLISGCDFEANSGVVGGAVNCENTMVLDCTFTDNTANSANSETFNGKTNNRGGFAGAIYNEGTITISDCEFDDNAGRGEGIRVKNAEISDSSFTNTRIDTCQNSNVLLTNNTYNNPDRDVQAASGTQVTVDVADGDIPNANTAPYIVGDLTFTDLQALIDSGSSGIRLTGNVIKTAEEETTFADGLNVDKTVTIYGAEGKVIQANSGKIFNVAEGKTLTLRNATLQGSGETAITNYGTVYLYLADNNQFTDCGDVLIDNHGRTTETGLTTFTQLNNLIGLVNGGTVYIGESKITKAEDEKEAYKNGIVIDKDLSILGSYNTYYKYVKTSINANNDGRIFTVAEGKSLSLKYINVTNGAADEGAGVYVSEDATLIADTANFIKNTAVTKGGAIYSEGTVDLTNVNIKNNTISKTDGVMADDNGGAALYNNGGTATLDKVNVTDNQKTYVIGDIMDGVVVSKGATTITNSYFANNSGRWGGAITQTGTDQTLTVEDTIFEENTAIFGAAIFDNSPLVVKDCKFYNNSAIGPGSPGTSNSQGAAILVMDDTASADISGSEFINNTADCGGAVSLAGVGSDSSIDDCTFIDNTAYADGGAVYFWTESASVTVTDSEFISNTAPYGGAIENEGLGDLIVDGCEFTENTASLRGGAIISSGDTSVSNSKFTDNEASGNTNAIYLYNSGSSLSLSNNVITGSDDAQIYVKEGIDVVTPLKVKILNNETVNINMVPYDITATVTDDKGNNIVDLAFRFTVGDDVVDGISIDAATGVYTATFTPTQAGEFVVSTNLANADEVQTGTLNVFRTLTDLKAIIDANTNGTIDLDGNYAYNAEFDSALTDGIVINKDIVINGNGFTICGENSTRLFHVTSGFLTLKNATVCHGAAEKGAGVYVDHGSKLSTDYVTFTENTAVKRGGAIYSEGMVYIGNSVLDSNNITFRSANDDNGGAAVYNLNGQLTIEKSNITNNLKDIVIRNGNAGDLLVGVVVTTGDTLIKDSYFANNTGSWGGAISSLGYMNTDDYTLTVKGTTFEGNNATFGGAIFVESSNLVVDDCIFNENTGVGKGSDGTSNTQGGAIVVHPTGSKATITNSKFNKNSANTGGAVSLAGVGQDSLIEGCTFTDNTANDGGAVYLWTGGNAIVTVKDSSFSDNTANFGSAISSDGTLSLSHNEIANDYTITPIGSYDGTIVSAIYVTTLNGETIITGNPTQNLTATITDDNGNPIVEKGLVLEVYGEEVETSYDKTTGIHSAIHTFTKPNSYRITAKGFDQDHTTPGYIVYTGGTFNELQDLINAAEEGATITLDHSIVYDEEFDGVPFLDGITVNKTVTIVGAEGVEICANNLARVFKVTDGATLTLKDATVCHGTAQKGAGVYVDAGASLIADNVTFTKNTAVKRGGAIYSEGMVYIGNSVLDSNNITFRSANDDNGGAAVYNLNGQLTIEKSNITNNLKDIVIRNGNAGDLLVGVVVTSGETLITDSYFANNTGSWGGAISSLGYMNNEDYTLTVIGTTFEGNNATFGGAIFVESSNLVVDDCTFNENAGVGKGSPGSASTQGGAIVVFPSGTKATITDSRFNKNSANTGGAVSLAGVDQDSLIEGCTFTENTGNDGGAVYLWTQGDATVTVKDSTFTGNTAGWGNAISTDGALKLEGNTISSTSADVGNWAGTIDSKVYAQILANDTYNWHMGGFVINATLTDDMGNLINDHNFNYVITKEGATDSISVPATFYTSLGYYQGTFTPADIGTYLISLDYAVEEVNTSVVVVSRSLIDLANIIAADEDGIIDLDDSYTYIEEFDSSIVDGIVIGKDVTINGNGHTICGDDKARLFHVTDKALTLNNVTLCHGNALNGGAVYVESAATLNANNAEFNENTATYRGGAIWSTGTVNVKDSSFDNNNITYRARNVDNGGAAIFNNGTLNVDHSNFTNDLVGYVVRTGDTNSPQLIDGIILSSGVAVINNSHFENNSGTYGGAITAVPIASLGSTATSLTVENCEFINNLAYCGAGISINADGNGKTTYSIKNSTFIGNNATGVGSTGSTSAGGAISIARDSEGTITDSKFYNNTATTGGAIDVSATRSSSKVTIDNCDFENNTATAGDGGAVRISKNNLEVAVKNSNFTNNDATGDGAAIYNNGVLTLEGNKVTSGETEIYVGPNGSVVNSIVKAIFLGDAEDNTILAFLGDEVHPYATLTDDNGNAIYDVDFNITVDGVEYETSYDDSTQQYTATYTILHAGDNIVSTNYDAQKTDGKYDVPKANATIVVTTESISVGDKATVNINLTGTDGVGLNGTVKITINKAFTDTVVTENGINVTEVEGLEIGEYFVYVYFEGNSDYNPEYNYTLFRVTGNVSYFNVTIEDVTYDDAATIKVTVQDGPIDDPDNGVTGIVLVTIQGKDVNFENTYSVSVIAGEGSYTVEGLAPGNYSYAAKLLADELYNEAYLEPQNFTVFENPYSELEVTDDGPIASGETVNITATLTDFQGNPIEGATLEVYDTGVWIANITTNAEGIAETSIDNLGYGLHDITVIFNDTVHDVQTETVTVSVTPKKGTFTDLQYLIDTADGRLVLPYDFAFDAAYDEQFFLTGVLVDDNIIISGAGHIIDGMKKARILYINAPNVKIFNVSFVNGKSDVGAAIYTEADYLLVDSCYFANNDPEAGAAIYAESGVTDVEETIFFNNTAVNGGAIYVESGATLNVADSEFNQNTATYRGGAIWSNGTVNVKDSSFDKNDITYRVKNDDNGGAAIFNNGTLNVVNSRFTNNLLNYVIRTGDDNHPELVDGVILSSGKAKISNSHFENNSGTYGSAITALPIGTELSDLTVENCEFITNLAYCGAAIYVGSGTTLFYINDCVFIGNNATGVGSNGYVATGGAIKIAKKATGIIADSQFYNNSAANGGAIDISATSGNTASVLIDSCVFGYNVADQGGAIYIDNRTTVNLYDSTLYYNEGEALNYHIFLNGDATLGFEGNNFYTTIPTIVAEDTYAYGETITINGTFDWGVNNKPINMIYTINGAPGTAEVVDGNYTILIDNQPDVGDYTIVITAFTDENGNVYHVETAQKTISVTKATPILSVEGDEYLMPPSDDATVTISLTDKDGNGIKGTVIVTVAGETYLVETDEDGDGELTINDLPATTWAIDAKFIGNDNYNEVVNDTEEITFIADVAYFDIIIEDGVYGDKLTVIVENATDIDGNSLTGMVTGMISTGDDDISFIVYVNNGQGTNTTTTAGGVGKFTGDAYFYDSMMEFMSGPEECSAYVSPANATLYLVPWDADDLSSDIAYGDTIEFGAAVFGVNLEELNGTVYYIITELNKKGEIAIVNGSGAVNLTDILDVGTYTVISYFVDDKGNYDPESSVNYTNFKVAKATPTLNVENAQQVYADTNTITFNVTGIDDKGVKGTVIAIKPISEDVSGAIYDPETGLGELTFNGLVVGDNPIVVKFLSDDDNYANAEKTINITITQATLAIDSTITTQEIVYGKDVEADVTVTGIVQEDTVIANVSLYDNATGELLDSFNIALGLEDSISFEDLEVGDYYYTIEFTSELYAGDNFTSEVFTVNTAEILDLDSSNVDNVSYGEGIDITVYVDGMIEGDLIEVNFTVVDATTGDDVFNGTYNISNGDVITVPPLDVGKYSYSVSFYGDDKYNTGGADSIAAVGSFEVLDMSDVDVLVTADESITYGEKVTVEIDPIVSEGGLPVTGTATIYVYDDPASVDPVYVLADVELDKDGATAVLDTILPTGEYWIVVDFESDDGYYDGRGVTSTIVDLALAKLSIDPITVTYGETIPITVTALGNGGELLNGTVEFKIYGPGFEGTVTVKNGTGVTNITERFDVGTYTIIAAFGDDGANYEGFNITSLEITPATPIVRVTGSEVEYGEPSTVTVSVSDIDGMPLSGKVIVTVDWVVDGLTQVIDLDDSNEASFDLSPYVHQGTYDVTVTYIANGNYGEAVNDTETVNVTASTTATVNVEVPEDVSYGDELTIKVTAEDGAGEQIPLEAVNVTVNGETKEYPVDENGTVNLGVLPAGDNEITVALDDGTHKPTKTEATAKVAPAEAVVFVDTDNDNPSYGDVVVVTVNATNKDKPIDADACLVVDGYLIGYYDLEDGQVEISIKDLAPGKHEIEVSVANGNYSEGSYGRAIVNVDKATPVISAEGETVEWGEVATVKVNATGANGEKLNIPLVVRVIWEVSGVDELIEIENGTGEAAFQISNYVAPGTYNVTVIFLGNDEYYPVNNTEAKIILTEPKTVEMEVSITPDEYGKATNVTVTLKDVASKPLEGSTVTVTVDGKEYANATIGEDGTVTVPVEGLEAGNHTIAVDFDDGEHSPVHEEENIAIEPSTDATVEATVNVGENETTVDVIVKDSTGEGINGTVIVYVDGEPVANTTVGNDTSSVSIGQLAPGDHTVDVEFVNPNYAPTSYSTHVTESTSLTNMTVKVDKKNILYGESDITATIEFTSEGKALDGVVEVLLNGEAQNVTVTGGKATVKFSDLAADHYTVVSNFAGNATYAPSSDSANFVVERKATKFNYNDMNTTAVNPNVDGRIGEYFYFQLVDQDGKALANKSVSIGFNGKVYNRTTNETGWAKLQINLRIVFGYTFAISFLGDDNYTGAFNVALINVSAQTPKLSTSSKVYKASAKTKTLTAKLLTSSGNVDKGKKLTFTVNGKSYSATTNDKGVASVKVSISQKGTYSFTVKNAKDNTYASVSKTAKLVIK
ncbi:adhesin-like protein [Methanobrevibacter ruminantium M1]|uniref:Adhesin-like protein n=1 Tax=Methanobrevibacter ruminantium (strain ATCC 35063 / DSM 1093 / JCM 13430 / OCM 146 / M1) TaxID=634498 RepID=D3E0W6_METRM|nr:Ig-like domain repeat protein [Methanobrevibacter ruminantium]ADC47940.1 adhesin-like protein [Methanobrevibacter ruminantium M1]